MANSERCGGVWRALALFTAVNAVVPWFLLSGVGRRPSTSLSGLLIAAIPIIGVGVAKLVGDTERAYAYRWAGLAAGSG